MQWNDHSKDVPEGAHAFLGASQHGWLKHDNEKLQERYCNSYATTIGTILHELASTLIRNGIKLAKTDKKLLQVKLVENHIPRVTYDLDFLFDNMVPYVNDAIGYKMRTEQVLYYSPLCFGTTDAIRYDEKNKVLRIHDYKSGTTPAHIEQLEVYAALFCLEYGVNPADIFIELRIYQSSEIVIGNPPAEVIIEIMNKIRDSVTTLSLMREAYFHE